MPAYYNENDPRTAAWIRELINAGLIAKGEVDERSILEVEPKDLDGFTQCHFFAGIGGWSYALRLAGWPDDKPVWTGSCPCQPFSQAGKGEVDKDERHLWPAFRGLIAKRNPSVCFGEQVCSPDGRIWLAGVRADLEAMGYVLGAVDTCAAGVGAPQIRQRLYWVANSHRGRWGEGRKLEKRQSGQTSQRTFRLGKPNGAGRNTRKPSGASLGHGNTVESAGDSLGMGNADNQRSQGWGERLVECSYQWPPGTANLAVLCTDGKARRFEPGSFPLADGFPGRVGLLRGYGNAIVPQVAETFIRSYLDIC